MTTARASQADVPAGFRRWRRTRPFWGGLLLLLSGLELLISANLTLGALQFHVGPTGFLSYVIPVMVVLCGVMSWLTPQVRMFYGVTGALAAVYSLIGVNLGGFFIGMLLGIVGAAMVIAWTPARPASTPDSGPAAATPTSEAQTEEYRDDASPAWFLDEHGPDDRSTQQYGNHAQHYADPQPHPAYPQQYPYEDERQQQWRGNDHNDGDPPQPPPYGGGGRGRLFGITLIPLTLAAGLLAAVPKSVPAYAAPPPCPTASGSPTTPAKQGATASKPPGGAPAPGNAAGGPGGAAPKPGAGQPAQRPGADKPDDPPVPSASAAPPATGTGHPLADGWNNFVDGVKRFFGGDKKEEAPEPTPSASTGGGDAKPSTQPQPGGQPSAPGAGKPSTPGPPNPKASGAPESSAPADAACTSALAPTDPDQPIISVAPGILTAGVVTMDNVAFRGVVELPTATGTVRALKFTMSKNVTSSFDLKVPERKGVVTEVTSTELTTQGDVSFYTTKFTGKVAIFEHGLFPVTFKPDDPLLKLLPPIPLPQLQFTEASIELVYVQCKTLTGKNLAIKEIRA